MPRIKIPIFSPEQGGVPIAGLFTLPDASTLGPGRYRRIEGLRWDRGVFRVREGTVRLTANAIASSGAYRGSWSGTLNGTAYEVVAYLTGGAVRVYKSTDFTSHTEITASSGPYGDTRLSDAMCSFAAVRDRRRGRDVLIISNGTDNPRVWDPQGDRHTNGTQVAIHEEIATPGQGGDLTCLASVYGYLAVGTGTAPTFTNSGGGLSLANTGSVPERYITLSVANPTATNDSATITAFSGGATQGLATKTNVVFLMDANDYQALDNIKIELRRADNSTFIVAYDPTDSSRNVKRELPFDPSSNKFLLVLSAFGLGTTTFDRVRFTWVGSATTTARTLNFYAMFVTHGLSGGYEFGITYGCEAARSQSYGQVAANVGGDLLSSIGGTSLSGMRLPVLQDLEYFYTINTREYATADEVDTIFIYAKPPGSLTFQYFGQKNITTWDGATWAQGSGSSRPSASTATIIGTTLTPLLDPSLTLPDGEHKPLQKGKYLLAANDRLFVGNISGAASEVWFSEDRNPFNFRSAVRFFDDGQPDPRSPGRLAFESEIVQGFGATPADSPTDPSNTVFIATDLTINSVRGLDAFAMSIRRREADVGTLSPKSVTTYRRSFLFLDSDRQVRILEGGQLVSLSRDTTEDKWRDIPAGRIDDVQFVAWKERLYIGYSSSGASTNDRLAGFNFFLKAWEFDEPLTSAATAEGLLLLEDRTNNRQRLMAFASDAKVYEIEQKDATQDNVSGSAANISVRITPGDLTGEGVWRSIYVRNIGVLMDDVTSGTLALVVTHPQSGQVQTFTSLSIDVSTSQAYRWFDTVCSFASDDLPTIGPRMSVDLQGSLLGGKNMAAIVAEIDRYDRDFADAV